MADAGAHGVTKTTPNATHRRGSARVMVALWLAGLLRPLLLRWGPTLRLMTSREPIDCGLYWGLGGVTDSTTVTKPAVHAVMVANHVNPKLQTISCQ